MLPENQGMWLNFCLFLLCWHSCWPSGWIYMPVDVFFQSPCGLSAAGSVLYFVVMQVLLLFCLSLLFNQWLQSHLCMTSMAVALLVLQPLLMLNHTIHILTACPSVHHLGLPFLFLPLSCSLVYLCMTMVFMVMLIPDIFSTLSNSCVWIANLLWIAVLQVCPWFLCCIG